MIKKPKLISSIRAKLVSAVAMLLVAVIMVVSSTYAWFTLSTAPEVKGIHTAIGANGSLEMALVPTDGNLDGIKTSNGAETGDINLTWGNLVSLTNNAVYGLDQITLYPSRLDTLGSGSGLFSSNILSIPEYGADGRVSSISSSNTVIGSYSGGSFYPSTNFGVRGVGVASGMSDRQLLYRNSLSASSQATVSAKTTAAGSLQNNGNVLANIIIKHATAGANETYTDLEVKALRDIVKDLQGIPATEGTAATIGVLEYIENAYMSYVLAYAASSVGQMAGIDDVKLGVIKSAIEDGTLNLAALAEEDGAYEYIFTALPEGVQTGITNYLGTVEDVDTASEKLKGLTDGSYTWDELRSPLYDLADIDNMTVNGFTAADIKDSLSGLVNSVTSMGGVFVTMTTGGGVYADIADHCGDYTAAVVIQGVSYGGVTLETLNATMQTKTTVTPVYLTQFNTAVSNKTPSSEGSSATLPITEFYGYIIDLAFRTNAAESNLLLQTTPMDRIYKDNTNPGAETMGAGSTMSFKAEGGSNFDTEDIKDLMKAIRIVFFEADGTNNKILYTAQLDTGNVRTAEDGTVTADIYLMKETVGEDGKTVTRTMITETKDAILKALGQNTPTKLSVLVYLDGDVVTNADVAAEATKSMTGALNLQFSSSATLQPMDYAALQDNNGDGAAYDVAVSNTAAPAVGIDNTGKATAGTDFAFKLTGTTTGTTYTVTYAVDGTDKGTLTATEGTYTIPGADITGAITITIAPTT